MFYLYKMKKLIIILLVLSGLSLNAQVPIGVNVRAGDSEIKGLMGVEFQISNFSLSGGWRPQKVWEQEVNSFTGAFTYYSDQWFESCFYTSIGVSSKGYFYAPIVHIPNVTGNDYIPEPSINILIGRRINFHDILDAQSKKYIFDAGIGLGISEHFEWFAFEVLFNFNLINNHINQQKFKYR